MPLRDRAALRRVGEREHILFKIERNAIFGHQPVYRRDHLRIAHVALCAVRREELVHPTGLRVRHAVQRHVHNPILIRVVDAPAGKGRIGKAHAALDADGRAHADGLRRREEFLRARDGIMVHQSAGGQARHAREIHRRRGRIGRKRIGGVDVVVHIRALGRKRLVRRKFLQVFQRCGRVRVEQRQGFLSRHTSSLSVSRLYLSAIRQSSMPSNSTLSQPS